MVTILNVAKTLKPAPVVSVRVDFGCTEVGRPSYMTVRAMREGDQPYTGHMDGIVIEGERAAGGEFSGMYTQTGARALLKALREYFGE